MSQPKDDDEIEEEIEEELSLDYDDKHLSLDSLTPVSKAPSDANNRKRKLFDFDEDVSEGGNVAGAVVKSKFDFDDDQLDDLLSGNKLAEHFKSEDVDDGNDNDDDDDDDEEQNVELEVVVTEKKDLSPDDIILINDQRVSINSLRNINIVSQENSWNNQSTTNDISDIVKDDTTNTSASQRRDAKMRKVRSFEEQDVVSPLVTERHAHSLDDLDFGEHSEKTFINEPGSVVEEIEDEVISVEVNDDKDDDDGSPKTPQLSEHNSVENDSLEEVSKVKSSKDDKSKSDVEVQQFLSSKNNVSQKDKTIDSDHDDASVKSQNDSINAGDLSSLDPNINIDNNSDIDRLLADTIEEPKDDDSTIVDGEEKQDIENTVTEIAKPLEKLEHSKEMLEDIAEESERDMDSFDISFNKRDVVDVTELQKLNSESIKSAIEKGEEFRHILDHHLNSNYEDMSPNDIPVEIPSGLGGQHSSDYDSVISLNMLQMMETKVKDLNEIIAGKDVCLAALNMQLEACGRRESLKEKGDSLKELPSSGRASSSLATLSTEYKTLQDDYASRPFDFQSELNERDNLIEQLTDSLQQSIHMREQLQTQSETLTSEVMQLRKQLTETLDLIKKPHWQRDQESNGQRISEISIDLVSTTDDESERNFQGGAGDCPENSNRNSRERQLDELYDMQLFPTFSKQIEDFLKFLSTDEMRIFNMVQKKFDEYLQHEIEAVKTKHDDEIKILTDRLESEKNDKELEMSRLRQLLSSVKSGSSEIVGLRHELETQHAQEMEDLRCYFERKCSDLEKQYSEEVFSQQSRRLSHDSGSEISDRELPVEENFSLHESPLRRHKDEIYASPTHRKLTPTSVGSPKFLKKKLEKKLSEPLLTGTNQESTRGIEDIKSFYEEKIAEISRSHGEIVKKLQDRLKQFEKGNADDEFISETNNEQHDFNTIISEYERRLKEQVALARQDVLDELDIQIKALLSENHPEDSHWPPELILLREKFTAKSQLEIAQLQIKHEDEMAKLKTDFEKQLKRKIRRQSTFDSSRDLDEVVVERDSLRELSNTLRWLLCELAKYCSICEDDFNSTFGEELLKHGIVTGEKGHRGNDDDQDLNISAGSVYSQRGTRFDVSGILSVIEEPSLLDFISQNRNTVTEFRLNIDDCLQKLRNEAHHLLKLSEKIGGKELNGGNKTPDKEDSCEEEDGLKKQITKVKDNKVMSRANSLNDSSLHGQSGEGRATRSLPIFSPQAISKESVYISDNLDSEKNSELNIQLHELRNRLLKSEDEKQSLEMELLQSTRKHEMLTSELFSAKVKIDTLEGQKETFMEGFGANLISPRHQATIPKSSSLIQLQEKAKTFLNQSQDDSNKSTNQLLQLIEDFCREGDRFMEDGKREKDDLELQIEMPITAASVHSLDCDKIEAADKQLKATRQFLEEQAAEREQERDDFTKEIEKLRAQLREREKEKHSYERVSKEVETMDSQIKEMTSVVAQYEGQISKLENDLKASIDKIYVLREIITDLESQLEAKTMTEHVLHEKNKELENYIHNQTRTNESLQQEVESLKIDLDGRGFTEKIANLEDKLRKSLTSTEQGMALEQITEQLRDIEHTLDKKTKTLESLHSAICSASCSSPSEDVSVKGEAVYEKVLEGESPRSPPSLPIDEVQRILDKLAKHTRAEEAAMKRIKDLEMQVGGVRQSYNEIQQERDILQEKLSEQMLRISSLQSRLDEQRHRAEELHRQGTSDLNIRVHDLQIEVTNLKETLSSRDKQIVTLRSHLEESKKLIDRQEAELAQMSAISPDEKSENELRQKNDEIQRLKHQIKNEMITKLALPDLMETMLADKNEENDHLREQLQMKETELKMYMGLNINEDNNQLEKSAENEMRDGKASARTLSDIVSLSSEYDEPDVIRKCVDPPGALDGFTFNIQSGMISQHMDSLPYKRASNEMTIFGLVNPQNVLSGIAQSNYFADISPLGTPFTPSQELEPRQLHFSLTDESNSIERMKKQSSAFIEEILEDQQLSDIIEEDHDDDEVNPAVKLKEEVANLNAKLKEAESLKLSMDDTLTEKKAIIERLQASVSNLQVEYAAKEKIYNEIISEKREMDKELNDMKRESMRMEQDLKLQENQIKTYLIKIEELEEEAERKRFETAQSNNFETFTQQIESLNKAICNKDDIISKFEKDIADYAASEKINIERIKSLEAKFLAGPHDSNIVETMKTEIGHLNAELSEIRHALSDKMLQFEKCKLDLALRDKEIKKIKAAFETASDDPNGELKKKLFNEITKNTVLATEVDKLKRDVDRMENSSSPKPFSLDEITKQVEKELNYSAQLDSNILKAIESDEINSDEDNTEKKKVTELLQHSGTIDQEFRELKVSLESEMKKRRELLKMNQELTDDIELLRQKFEQQQLNSMKLQALLDAEKKNSMSIQQQDATIIEAMRLRLEAAIDNESDLQKRVDEERSKSERLTSQVSSMQRIQQSNSLPGLKSQLPGTPKKYADSDNVSQLESEILFLTAQNEREKERVNDLQRVLERERNRFDKEVIDRKEFAESMKKEIERVSKDNELLQQQLDNVSEKLELAHGEIENLEVRLGNKSSRHHKSQADIATPTETRRMRERIFELEKERDKLNESMYLLRGDIDRGAQRETKLAEALARETSGEGQVPQIFLQKLKETNDLLVENAKENRQMADTLQFLTEERRNLQNRIVELETGMGVLSGPRDDLEERANHLFGKYLRCESFRKALVHQKRYLLIEIAAYQKNEARAMSLVKADRKDKLGNKKRKSLRSYVFVIIAILRMKYIVKRWHTGKRVGASAIFSQSQPRRSASATTNHWARSETNLTQSPSHNPGSPPCRDRPQYLINHSKSHSTLPSCSTSYGHHHSNRPLQSPAIISKHHKSYSSSSSTKSAIGRLE